MTIRSTAALIELRALIGGGQYTGTRIRRLVIRASAHYPDKRRLPDIIDELHINLEQAEVERDDGVGPFSLPLALETIDEFEEAERRAAREARG